MADKKISELTTASEIKNGDNLELSQDTGSGLVSLKATILAIANKILKGINFTSDLQTTDKTVIGAINEVAQGGGGGSSTLGGLNDVDIDDTTLADGQALVYNGNEEKWVNGQGGGGTGGHTIIDENGNSMTARAGLQFVGADVSDDATNNKTIVDLASAGGIDGVFYDMSNVIVQRAEYDATQDFSYTATQDCAIFIEIVNIPGSDKVVRIDGEWVESEYSVQTGSHQIRIGQTFLLKKGQTLTVVANATAFESVCRYAVYGIQTGTTHSKFQPVIYSLEEREVGVWTDGKPLYEKTIIWTDASTGNNTLPHGISDVDYIFITDWNFDNVLGFEGTSSNWWAMVYDCNKTNIKYNLGSSWGNSKDLRVTFQYTKTTDVAGSGSWTPQGVPAHHYSEDEQVIGTWIDGKTLYEKTINFGALPNADNKSVAHNISNLDTVVSYEAISSQDLSGTRLTLPDLYTSGGQFYFTRIRFDSSNIIVTTTADRSSYTKTYVTIRYTKSS